MELDRILAQMEELLDDYHRLVEESRNPDADPRYGVAATRMAAAAGNLIEIEESIRRGVFLDFLNMAVDLLEESDQRYAAVSAGILAGATLEQYLRKLADAYGIETANSGGEPVKAESLNTKLRGEGVYDLSEQMQVTAWLELWNKAARGRRDEFSADEVRLMIQGVRDLMIRHPA